MNIFYCLIAILLFGVKRTNSIETGKNRAKSLENLRAWIHSQRRPNWGWAKDTSRAIVALALSYQEFDLNDTTIQLMSKQMKFELLQILSRRDRMTLGDYEYQLASYVHSLLATCSNPRNFEGFDLVKILKESIDRAESINPMVALALCNCNGSLNGTHILKLIEIAVTQRLPRLLDLQAYALMALSCFREKYSSLNRKLIGTAKNYAKLQNNDGSFENVYTTALMVHALLSIKHSTNAEIEWNVTNAYDYIASLQKENGSFGDMFSSYLILPLLNDKTLTDLRRMNCSIKDPDNEGKTVQEELDSGMVDKYRMQYFIFKGEEKNIAFGLSLRIPINSTFYDVMRLAAELDSRFRFEHTQHSWGIYVYSVFGIVNNPESRNYWRIYKTVGNSTFLNLQQLPDQIIPKEDDTYIFWYKYLN